MRPMYAINRDIEFIISQYTDDNGVLEDEGIEALEALSMEREAKIENLILAYRNQRAYKDALKNEEVAFRTRREAAENKLASLKKYIERCLGGEKFDTGRARVAYRRTKALEVEDPLLCVTWLASTGHADCLRQKDPEIDKQALTRLIKRGDVEVPGASLVERLSMSIP